MKQKFFPDHTLRAFIALELPEHIQAALHEIQVQLKAYGLKVTWTRPENIHLTLKFLGDIQKSMVAPISDIIEHAAKQCPCMTLRSQALGFFPGVKHPRVLWTGVAGQTDLLEKLQRNIDAELARHGFPKDTKSFIGHLTLGRMKSGGNPEIFIGIMQRFQHMTTDDFIVDRLHLYQSKLMPSGPIYTKIFSVSLQSDKNQPIQEAL